MSIIVLEGASGSGKTELAEALRRVGALVYRAFRSARDGHAPGTSEPDLVAGRVPVNTWVEDVVAADVLASLSRAFFTNYDALGKARYEPAFLSGHLVVLDRSLPSALAWDVLKPPPEGPMSEAQRKALMRVWTKRMVRAGGVIALAQGAHPSRFPADQVAAEQSLVAKFCQESGLKIFPVATASGLSPDALVENLQRSIQTFKLAAVLRTGPETSEDGDA